MAAFGHCHRWFALAHRLLDRGVAWLVLQLYQRAVSAEFEGGLSLEIEQHLALILLSIFDHCMWLGQLHGADARKAEGAYIGYLGWVQVD